MPFSYSRAVRWLGELEWHGVKLGLENVRVVLSFMGDPQRGLPSVIVGGTNGKGSVAAMLESISRETGLRTGLYTSPHLVDRRERIRVRGRPISRAAFGRAAEAVWEAMGRARQEQAISRCPTYFEVFTAMALHHFAVQKVELAILEVGMGGRFDATNVAEPCLSIITNVSLDHTRYLGRTVGEIAREKAGIIKEGKPVVTGARRRALQVVRERARQLGAPLHDTTAECRVEVADPDDPPRFDLSTPVRSYPSLELGLRGRHQIDNAVLAVRAAEILQGTLGAGELPVRRGLRNVVWPARLDIRPGSPRLLFDVAHNPDGIRTLRAYLDRRERSSRTVALLGITEGRDAHAMVRRLGPAVRQLVLTRPPGKKSVDPHRLKASAESVGGTARVVEDWREALRVAEKEARSGDLLVIAGSIYLVGAVMEELETTCGQAVVKPRERG